MIELDPKSTAHELLARGQALAERFRAAKATVVLVNVAFSADGGDMLLARPTSMATSC
jgi:hypothetical protein